MRDRLIILLILGCGALLQQVLPPWSIFGGIKPPILAALALYYAFRRDTRGMWLAVFGAAILHDSLDQGSFGPALLTFPVFGILGNKVRTEIFAEDLFAQLFLGAAMGLFTMMATIMIYGITGQRPMHFGHNLMRLFGAFCLGLCTFPLITLAINKLMGLLPKRRGYGWQ